MFIKKIILLLIFPIQLYKIYILYKHISTPIFKTININQKNIFFKIAKIQSSHIIHNSIYKKNINIKIILNTILYLLLSLSTTLIQSIKIISELIDNIYIIQKTNKKFIGITEILKIIKYHIITLYNKLTLNSNIITITGRIRPDIAFKDKIMHLAKTNQKELFNTQYLVGDLITNNFTRRGLIIQKSHPTMLEYLENICENNKYFSITLTHSGVYINTVGYHEFKPINNELKQTHLYSNPSKLYTTAQPTITSIDNIKNLRTISTHDSRLLFNNNNSLNEDYKFDLNKEYINMKLYAYRHNSILLTSSNITSSTKVSDHINELPIKDILLFNNIHNLNNSEDYAKLSILLLIYKNLPKDSHPETIHQKIIVTNDTLDHIKKNDFDLYNSMLSPSFIQTI